MKLHHLLMNGVITLALLSGGALAADDKAAKQAEIRTVAQASLEKFYAAQPELRSQVAKAPGYGVFTTYGLSFLVGGAGGKGLVHNNKTKKDTFMAMAQASAGAEVGIAESETLIIFASPKSMDWFVNKGWGFGDAEPDHDRPGLNYRLTELQAAVGVAQLAKQAAPGFVVGQVINLNVQRLSRAPGQGDAGIEGRLTGVKKPETRPVGPLGRC